MDGEGPPGDYWFATFGGNIPLLFSVFKGPKYSSKTPQIQNTNGVHGLSVSGITPTTQHNNPEDLKTQIPMLRRPVLLRT
jgi:hypothetical protein